MRRWWTVKHYRNSKFTVPTDFDDYFFNKLISWLRYNHFRIKDHTIIIKKGNILNSRYSILKAVLDPDVEDRGWYAVIIIGEPGVENSFCWPCGALCEY